MSSKTWIERAIVKPANVQTQSVTGKHARLAEALLKMMKEKDKEKG